MRVNVVIDDALMKRAVKLSDLKTNKSVIETGVRLLIQIKEQEQIRKLHGKLNWTGGLKGKASGG